MRERIERSVETIADENREILIEAASGAFEEPLYRTRLFLAGFSLATINRNLNCGTSQTHQAPPIFIFISKELDLEV